MAVQIVMCRKTLSHTPCLIWFRSTADQAETASLIPPVFLSALSPAAYVASVIDCWMKLDMFGREEEKVKKKGQALWESLSLRAFCSTGHLQGHFLSSSTLAKGSTVGQLAIELQPLLCGGVGQIRPHNCLGSQMGTAASLRPLKPATGCRPFGSHLCVERSAAVIVERFLPPLRRFFVGEGWEGAGRGVVNEWHLDWINASCPPLWFSCHFELLCSPVLNNAGVRDHSPAV